MGMAKIFSPIRWSVADAAAESPTPQPLVVAALSGSPARQAGAQPVTNTLPPGSSLFNTEPPLASREEGWLALLEMVFETTGWPDADEAE